MNSKTKDYSQLSQEQLIEIINQLEKKQEYGLVWDAERVPEQVVEDCKTKLPVLVEDKTKRIQKSDDDLTHILIEGDNYHALSTLAYTHAGKIDLIYIDPPYNTGSKDFKYNDKFIDKIDTFRHSKWLQFMSKRLEIAYSLLKDEGVMFISINEDEYANLKLLCDKLFFDINYMTTFTVKVRHEDRILKGDKDFHEVVEYMLMYRKSSEFKTIKRIYDNTSNDQYLYKITELDDSPDILECGKKSVKVFKPEQFKIEKCEPSETNLKVINIRGSIKEGNSSGRFFMKYLEKFIGTNLGYLFKVPDMGDDGLGYRYFYVSDKASRANGDYFQGVPTDRKEIKEVPYSNFLDFESDFNNVGYEGGVEFRNGKKPLRFLDHILTMGGIKLNKDAIILDFFAGSGSTGNAVLNLNMTDEGRRQFILCTNNENNIAEEITHKRIQKVIEGYGDNQPKPANLRYYKTDFVENIKNKAQLKINITWSCTEMLCIKEGVFELLKENNSWKIFKQGGRVMAVYYDFNQDDLESLKSEIIGNSEFANCTITLYQFCQNANGFSDSNLLQWEENGIILKPIPQKILDIYDQLYK